MAKIITRRQAGELIDTSMSGLVSAYDWANGSLDDLVGSNNGSANGPLDCRRSMLGNAMCTSAGGVIDLGTGFSGQTDFFMSLWYRNDGTGGTQWPCDAYASASDAIGLRLAGNTLDIRDDIDNANGTHYATDIPPNAWVHIVWGIDSGALCYMWINGAASANDESAAANFSSMSSPNVYLLGRRSTDGYAGGNIAGVQIFDRVLTQSDVDALFSPGRQIVSYFDSGVTATEATFASGRIENTDWEIQSGSYKVVDDGNGKYIECVTAGEFAIPVSELGYQPGEAGYMQLECWLYKEGNDVSRVCFVGDDRNATTCNGYRLDAIVDETLRVIENGSAAVAVSSQDIPVLEWAKVTVTRSPSGEFAIYLNGTQTATGTDTTVAQSTFITVQLDPGSRIGLSEGYQFSVAMFDRMS